MIGRWSGRRPGRAGNSRRGKGPSGPFFSGLIMAALGLAMATPAAAKSLEATASDPLVQSRTLTCAQAAGLVQDKGVVVMATSPTLYDRYVRDLNFCLHDQLLRPEWVPTRDAPQCFVGYVCQERMGAGEKGN